MPPLPGTYPWQHPWSAISLKPMLDWHCQCHKMIKMAWLRPRDFGASTVACAAWVMCIALSCLKFRWEFAIFWPPPLGCPEKTMDIGVREWGDLPPLPSLQSSPKSACSFLRATPYHSHNSTQRLKLNATHANLCNLCNMSDWIERTHISRRPCFFGTRSW